MTPKIKTVTHAYDFILLNFSNSTIPFIHLLMMLTTCCYRVTICYFYFIHVKYIIICKSKKNFQFDYK